MVDEYLFSLLAIFKLHFSQLAKVR